MSNSLLSCPFCGGAAKIVEDELGYKAAECSQCKTLTQFRDDMSYVETWNQRQPHPDVNYRLFYESVSCLLAEGVEFMSKIQIYEAIKREHKKYKPESLQQAMEQEK